MPAILLTWAIVIPTFVGVGLLLQRLYGVRETGAAVIVRAFWMGFAANLGLAQTWSLFWPVNGLVWLVILPLGVVGLACFGRSLRSFAVEAFRRRSVALLVSTLLVLAAVRIAVSGASEVPFPDTGSYHLHATLWAHAYPVVPGLSNLNCRIGFNSSFFPYAAMFAEGPWNERPHHVVMGVLLLMLLATALVGATRQPERSGPRVANVLAASFAAPATYLLILGERVSSLSPNVAITFLILLAAWQIVTAVTSQQGPEHEPGYTGFCAGVFLVTATTIKLTVAPFAIAALAVIHLFSGNGVDGSKTRPRLKPLAWLTCVSLLLMIPWLIRGVVTSGYPFYPSSVAGFDVDWRVPDQQVVLEAEWVNSFSRRSLDRPPQGYEWVGHWASEMAGVLGFSVPLGAVVVAGFCFPLLRFLPCGSLLSDLEGRAFRMLWPAVVGLVTWFLSAPDPRFSMGYVWLLFGLVGSCLLVRVWRCFGKRAQFALLATVAAMVTAEAVWFLRQSGAPVFAACLGTRPDGAREKFTCGLQGLPPRPFRTYVTLSGLSVTMPVYGNWIWGAPLLSTPHPSPNLKLRNPNDISAGFASDGPWKPLRFPNDWDGFREYVAEQVGLDSPTQAPAR